MSTPNRHPFSARLRYAFANYTGQPDGYSFDRQQLFGPIASGAW